MKSRRSRNGFTRLELLISLALLLFIVAMLIPARSGPSIKAYRTICAGNLRQLHQATQMYFYDWAHGPQNTNATLYPFLGWTDYRKAIGTNVPGVKGGPSPKDSIFACPKDSFYYTMSDNESAYVSQPLHEQSNYVFTSYAYNAGYSITPATNRSPAKTNLHGIAGMKLESVAHPSRTVLLAEFPALAPYSWHNPKSSAKFDNAQDMLVFVDGHAAYTKTYYDGKKPAWDYNPPAGYDYQWSGD